MSFSEFLQAAYAEYQRQEQARLAEEKTKKIIKDLDDNLGDGLADSNSDNPINSDKYNSDIKAEEIGGENAAGISGSGEGVTLTASGNGGGVR